MSEDSNENIVVFLEDNRQIQLMYKQFCKMDGINGVFYERPPSIEILLPYRTIITDFEMPEQSGLEVALQLRERGWDGKIALVSSLAESIYPLGCFDAYLVKPFTIQKLRGLLEELVGITPTQIKLE